MSVCAVCGAALTGSEDATGNTCVGCWSRLAPARNIGRDECVEELGQLLGRLLEEVKICVGDDAEYVHGQILGVREAIRVLKAIQ